MSGIHIVDILVVAAYLGIILYLGKRSSHTTGSQEGFFLAGRKLGKLYQFFLNFGNATDANGAVSTATLVYQQGVSGAWQAFQTVFMNPYYWFMNVWFRRVRLVTVAELFEERLGSRNLAKIYAFYQVTYVIFFIGWANLIGYNVTASLLTKPESAWSVEERQQVGQFREYRTLQALKILNKPEKTWSDEEVQQVKQFRKSHESQQTVVTELSAQQRVDFEKLGDLYAAKRLRAAVSYIEPYQFYLGFTLIVGCYLFMGGMTGAARNEILQGILIVTFSLLLIPFGFHALAAAGTGGQSGVEVLRARVDTEMLQLLGASGSGFVSLSALIAILLVSIIQINGIMGNMGVSGSAKNEYAARFGAVSGTYAKRIMIIMWSFVGLIGFAYFLGGNLSDPDVVWGELSRQLLTRWSGLFGLMMAGLLAAMMSNIATNSMAASALFVRNVYSYIVTDKAKQKGVLVGRLTVVVVLVLGMCVALGMNDIVSFINLQLTVNVPWGAAIVLMFFWRRLSNVAVWSCVGLSALFTILIPYSVQHLPALSQAPALIQKTEPRAANYTVVAPTESLRDIAAARKIKSEKLARVNDLAIDAVVKQGTVLALAPAPAPVGIYFAKIVRTNPEDLNSPQTGMGRFNFEAWMLQKAGLVNLKHLTKPDLQAVQFYFDGVFPFIVLIVVSLLTKAPAREKVNYFFGKMKTPVGATPELEVAAMEETRRDPNRFDHTKLFPHSAWELTKWDKTDTVGFVICLGVSGSIVALFWFLLSLTAGT
jgi:Na+/proline symporter